MLLLLDHNEKISVDTIILGSMALTLDCHLHSGLNSCRNLHLNRLTLSYQTGAAAGMTWV